jgi:hypothetical protein
MESACGFECPHLCWSDLANEQDRSLRKHFDLFHLHRFVVMSSLQDKKCASIVVLTAKVIMRLDFEVLSKLEKFVNFRGKSPISIAQNRELGGKYSDGRN